MSLGKIGGRHLGIILLAAFVVYGNTLANGFVYDDVEQILANPWLRDPAGVIEIFTSHVWGFSPQHPIVTNYYRPLMHTANLAVYTLFGPNPVFFHLLSLLLHLGCCGLLYLAIRELTRGFYPDDPEMLQGLPFLGALFFAVYPANAEAVAWLGSSADLLCGLFLLTTLYCYLRGERTGRSPFRIFSVLAFAGALLSKETAVLTAPLLIFITDVTTGRLSGGAGRWSALRRYAPFVLVGMLYLLLRIGVLGALIPVRKYTLGGFHLVLSGVQKFLWYIGKLAWPFSHNFLPELQSPTVYSGGEAALMVLLFALTLGGLLLVAWRNRVLRVLSVVILIPLFTAMQAHVLKDPVAYRYLYIPALGFCPILAWLVVTFVRWRKVRIGLVVALCLLWGGTAMAMNRVFVDGVTIWATTVAKSPRSLVARSWYARELFDSGRIEEGVAQTRVILELGSSDAGHIYQLAAGLHKLGRLHEARGYYEMLLGLGQENVWVYTGLGRVLLDLGEVERAVASLEEAARHDPADGVARFWLARAYEQVGNAAAAREAYLAADRLLPTGAPERGELPQRLAGQRRQQ